MSSMFYLHIPCQKISLEYIVPRATKENLPPTYLIVCLTHLPAPSEPKTYVMIENHTSSFPVYKGDIVFIKLK